MRTGKKLFILMSLFAFILASAGPGHALVGPDQDLSDIPPWLWPIVLPVSVIAKTITGKSMTFQQAAEQMKDAVAFQCECFAAGEYEFAETLAMVEAQLNLQLETIKLAKIKAGGFSGGEMVAYDEDDWCGTPPRPRPWPWPWPPYLIDLVELQTQMFKSEIMGDYKLTRSEIKLLDTELNQHVENFAAVLK